MIKFPNKIKNFSMNCPRCMDCRNRDYFDSKCLKQIYSILGLTSTSSDTDKNQITTTKPQLKRARSSSSIENDEIYETSSTNHNKNLIRSITKVIKDIDKDKELLCSISKFIQEGPSNSKDTTNENFQKAISILNCPRCPYFKWKFKQKQDNIKFDHPLKKIF